MMKLRIATLAASTMAALLLASTTGIAHHAISAKFDDKRPTTLTGVVTLVDWRNPHVHVFMNVKDAKGVLNWAVEIESPIELETNGWNRETLQPGDAITVRGILARNDSRQVWGNSIVLASTNRQVLKFTPKIPTEPLEKRPTPRWADSKQPRLGPTPGGVQGYWAYPTATVLQETGANVKMDQWGLLANVADASKVAPMQPWALALYRNRQSRFLQDDPTYLNCKPPGGPRQFQLPYGVQFVEDRERQRIFVLIGGGNANYRIIYLDGRSHAGQVGGDDDNPLYYGRSVGKWVGRCAGGRYQGLQRGLLVHQRRPAAYRAASAGREVFAAGLRYVEVRGDRRRYRCLHTTMVQRMDVALGGGRGTTAAPVSGKPTVGDMNC
jgi:hypothetical protein